MNEYVVPEQKQFLTVRNILRVLSVLCIAFVFCPVFLVSCSGEEVEISAMKAVTGISIEGEQIVEPHPIMLIALLIPVAALALLIMKNVIENEKMLAALVAGCMAADVIVWNVFKSKAQEMAEESYCSFETTGWYTANMVVLVAVIALSALVVVNIWKMDADLIALFTGEGARKKINQMSATVTQVSKNVTQMSKNVAQMAGNAAENIGGKERAEDVLGFCPKCGGPIPQGSKFCTSCGAPVPESMLAQAEKPAEAQPRFCRHCGTELGPDAAFCKSCGTKTE